MRKTDVRDRVAEQDDSWFVPRRFGIGVMPVTWQGWALTIGFVLALLLDIRFMPERIAQIAIGIGLSAAFMLISIRTTRGGWGWHWGDRG